jgi:integrase
VIALWLGHESVETTQIYLHADMRLKEEALSRPAPLGVKPARYHPDDKLLALLESL